MYVYINCTMFCYPEAQRTSGYSAAQVVVVVWRLKRLAEADALAVFRRSLIITEVHI